MQDFQCQGLHQPESWNTHMPDTGIFVECFGSTPHPSGVRTHDSVSLLSPTTAGVQGFHALTLARPWQRSKQMYKVG